MCCCWLAEGSTCWQAHTAIALCMKDVSQERDQLFTQREQLTAEVKRCRAAQGAASMPASTPASTPASKPASTPAGSPASLGQER